ncbi:MerR family transcriptional regulator [Clostridioides sp. ES-S-0005-03]|uniref:MerR family transcriptional regulator n=1 Tax=Clostridioides sp. ES-S-0005-03 TaxID=2770774 RepID=UPI001D11A682|nr:MerR family transcriptional regulator [Clostridioides sp. ES-S-0005-03]UDN46378.1 MerR family transcriptional regulator [Clostridioides sp. ES-S-0173-01]
MTIKEASKRTGISVDNLRYYERIGLIPPIPKNKSGIRDYDERAIHWIEFVMKFKKAGASLEAIIEYVRLACSDDNTKEVRREILVEVKEDLTTQISKLQECLDVVEYKIENYYNLCDPVTQKMVKEWKEKHEYKK